MDSNQIWEAMLEDIRNASRSIEIEQYCFWDDRLGHRFLDLFEEKLKQGVEIRLICDAIGSLPLFYSRYVKKLQKQGLQLVRFNPIRPWHFSALFYRNHKKTMIVDGRICWVGGVGLKEKFGNMRDSQVRIEDSIATAVQDNFNELWDIARDRNFLKELRMVETEQKVDKFKLLTNGPALHQKEVLNWLNAALSSAEKYIYLTSPYFIPSKNLLTMLAHKSKHGVDVRILSRGKNDDNLSGQAAASYFQLALDAGIKIYTYSPKILHAKTIVIDDKVASIGSTNLNSLSLRFSYEANIVSENPQFVAGIKQQFLNDLTVSEQVISHNWKKRGLLLRLMEIMTWPMHGYL